MIEYIIWAIIIFFSRRQIKHQNKSAKFTKVMVILNAVMLLLSIISIVLSAIGFIAILSSSSAQELKEISAWQYIGLILSIIAGIIFIVLAIQDIIGLNKLAPKQDVIYCPACGTAQPADSQFCIACGQKINE